MHLTSIEIAYRFPYANAFFLFTRDNSFRMSLYTPIAYYLQFLESMMMIILADSDYYLETLDKVSLVFLQFL